MRTKIACLFLLFGGFLSCQKSDTGTEVADHFFLQSEGAVMPVFVNGNVKSNVFVIYLHGGPGGTSLEAYQHPESPFTKLQNDFAVVYWDQRCAGASQGENTKLTLNQYTNDLEKLIVLLKHKYGTQISFFLVGHSWGGSLGVNYLTRPQNQQNVKGWIEVGGGHNVPRIVALERDMVLTVGNRQIQLGNNATDWQNIINQAQKLNLTIIDDLYKMNVLAVQAEGLMRNKDSVNAKISNNWISEFFSGPTEVFRANKNLELSVEGMKEELAVINLSDKLQNITVPTLMIWGNYDFRVPPEFANEELQKYGSEKKELVIFEKSAHFVQWNEPLRFYEVVNDFIDRNK